jgi:hypothetical protein
MRVHTIGKMGARSLAALLLLGMGLGSARAADEAASTKDQVLELTGGRRAKVVWNQGGAVRLFDTRTGEIQDLPIPNGSAPILTLDGTKVLVSAGQAPDGRGVYLYDIESGGVTEFPKGPGNNLMDVWQDPADGRLWAYVNGTGDHGENWDQARGGAIYRFPLDKPEQREQVWDRTSTHIWMFLSADGTRACFEPSWGNIGMLTLAVAEDRQVDQDNSSYQQFGGGCFPSIAPDNSYRLFRLDGDHRSITMHEGDNSRSWQVNVSHMVDGRNVWLTRWSRHPQYITLMGPDSDQAKIWMGRFNEDFTEVEQWVQINHDGPKSMQSHSWVETEAAGR